MPDVLAGTAPEVRIDRHLWESTAAELEQEIRELHATTALTIAELGEMYRLTEWRIRRILGSDEGMRRKRGPDGPPSVPPA